MSDTKEEFVFFEFEKPGYCPCWDMDEYEGSLCGKCLVTTYLASAYEYIRGYRSDRATVLKIGAKVLTRMEHYSYEYSIGDAAYDAHVEVLRLAMVRVIDGYVTSDNDSSFMHEYWVKEASSLIRYYDTVWTQLDSLYTIIEVIAEQDSIDE
jgi:hypothetical protein